ncbi:MAG: PASTA domain-containing protein [Planctomycetales bacterium]|nr:PASTA domain-containing protein [Planctomycetales bacterium]
MVGRYQRPLVTWVMLGTFVLWSVAPPEIVAKFVYGQTDEQVTVPALMGLTAIEAIDVLKSIGLTADVHLGVAAPREFSRQGVYEVQPEAGAIVRRGSAIRLVIHADEVKSVEVTSGIPDVIGLTVAEARQIVSTAGYEVDLRLGFHSSDDNRAMRVYSQTPKPGQAEFNGQSVKVVFYAPTQPLAGSEPQATLESLASLANTPALMGVFATPFVEERREKVHSRSGTLIAEHLDATVPAGAISLDVRRFSRAGGEGIGLLGAQWQLNWEKRLARRNGVVAIHEKGGWLLFRPYDTKNQYLAADGSLLTVDTDSAVCLRPDSTKETYNAKGQLVEVDCRNKNIVSVQYDSLGRLVRVEGPHRSFLNFVTDNTGRLTQIGASNGSSIRYFYEDQHQAPVRFNYDQAGQLASIRYPRDGETSLAYDEQGRVVRRRFADGALERWEYDDEAQVTRFIDAGGAVSTTSQNANSNIIERTTALGHKTRIETDDLDRPISITAPGGETVHLTFDDMGRLTAVTQPGKGVQQFEYHGDTHVLTSHVTAEGKRVVRQHDLDHNLLSIAHQRDDDKDARFDYSTDGLLQRVQHRGGRSYSLKYDDHGRVSAMSDAAGNTATFEYDQHGRLLRWVDPEGRATTNNYDLGGRLSSSTNASGATTRFAYNEAGLLSVKTDASGNRTKYDYDARGRKIAETDALGRTQKWSYNAIGALLAETNAAGETIRYEYDADGNLVRQINSLGGATTTTVDAAGRRIAERNEAGGTTKFEYSANGLLASRTDPDGGKITFEYDADGMLTAQTDRYGKTTRFEYDLHGNLLRTVSPTGVVTTREYNEADDLVAVFENGQRQVSLEYDKVGNCIRKVFASGLEVSYEFDAEGRQTAWKDNLGRGKATRHDIEGRPLEITDSDGSKIRYRYDLAGALIGVTDALRNSQRRAYDAAGQLTSLTEASGDKAEYEYDAAGRIAKVIRPSGGTNLYAYDSTGKPIQFTDPLGNVVRTLYDAAGRLTSSTDALGQTTRYVYNAAGQLLEKRLDDGRVVSYRYDDHGNLIEVDDGEFPVHFAFDEFGRQTRVEYSAITQSFDYQYDNKNRMTSRTSSDGSKTIYNYDENDRLVKITVDDTSTTLEYDAANRRTGITYPNGVQGRWSYNSTGRIASVKYTDPAGHVIAEQSYTYDATGQLTETHSSNGDSLRYRYDRAGQLIAYQKEGQEAVKYEYAPGGNRSKRTTGEAVVEYEYDTADRLIRAGDESFVYDDHGNLIERTDADGTTHYGYDAENRLVRVDLPNGKGVSFGYAPTGERIWREDESGRTWFVNDGTNLVAELNDQLQPVKSYIQGPSVDDLLAVQDGERVYGIHTDHIGSVSWLTNDDGNIAEQRQFSPFGRSEADLDVSICRFGFTGREFDSDLGLYYYRARYFDASLGRFLAPDPVPPKQDRALTLNPFHYALNSPTNYVDPLGTDPTYSPKVDSIRGQLSGMTPQQQQTYLAQQQHFLREMLNNFHRGYRVPVTGAGQGGSPAAIQAGLEADMRAVHQLQIQAAQAANAVPTSAPTPAQPPSGPNLSLLDDIPDALSGLDDVPTPRPSQSSVQNPTPATGIKLPSTSQNATPPAGTRVPNTYQTGQSPGNNTQAGPKAVVRPSDTVVYPVGGTPTPGYGSRVWNNIRGGVTSRVGRVFTAGAIVGVVYATATAARGHRIRTGVRGLGAVGGGLVGGALGGAIISNPVGWGILGAVLLGMGGGLIGGQVGGSLGDIIGIQIGDLFSDPTQGNSPPRLDPNHPMTGDVADNPLFQRQQQSAQGASPPADPLAGTPASNPGMRGRDFLRALPDLTRNAASPPTPSSVASSDVNRQIFRQLPPPTKVAGTPAPSKPSMNLPPLPTLKSADQPHDTTPAKPKDAGNMDGLYAVGGAYNAVATRFLWKQIDANTASVTLYLDGRESNIMRGIQGIPATATVTAKRTGTTYVAVNSGALPTVLTRSITFTPVAAGTINYSHVQGNGISTSGVATRGR